MVRLLSPSFTLSTLLQLLLELSVLFVAAALIGTQYSGGLKSAVPSALVFAVVLVSLNAAFGIYRRAERLSSGPYVLRMFLAGSIGIPLAFAIDAALPGGGGIGDNAGPVIGAALGLLLLRHALVLPMVTALAPHRVLVLGTGREAHDVAASLAAAGAPGLSIVGFYPLAASDERFAPGMRVLEEARCRTSSASAGWRKSSWRCTSSGAACCHCGRYSTAGSRA